MWCFLTAVTTMLIAALDYFVEFGISNMVNDRALISWAGLFIMGNSILSILLYFLCEEYSVLSNVESGWLRAIIIGLGYFALVNLKLTNIRVANNQPVSLGLEYIYRQFKNLCYSNAGEVLVKIQFERDQKLVADFTLKEIAMKAKYRASYNNAGQNSLNPDRRRADLIWLTKVLNDEDSPDDEKAIFIAHYVNFGEIPNEINVPRLDGGNS